MRSRLVSGASAFLIALAALLFLSVLFIHAAPAAPSVTWTDDFDAGSLAAPWWWVREDPGYWSLTARSGFLRITTQETFTTVNNILVQAMPPGEYQIEARVLFTPTENFQLAGLVVYLDDGNFLSLGRGYCDSTLPACAGNAIYFDRIEDSAIVGSNYPLTTTLPAATYLRLARVGDTYTASASIDGVTWTQLGSHAITFAPTAIGLRASNQMSGAAAEIPADFDYFILIDSSHHLFLPALTK
jgi:beta-xylosidase